MTDEEECSYNGCTNDAITTLEIEGDKVPGCSEHLDQLAKGQNGQTQGRYPVLTNNEDQAAWINTDKNGNTYLSIKIEDGEYLNLFPQSDALQITLNQLHEAQKKDE
jgi:hypothetical protein